MEQRQLQNFMEGMLYSSMIVVVLDLVHAVLRWQLVVHREQYSRSAKPHDVIIKPYIAIQNTQTGYVRTRASIVKAKNGGFNLGILRNYPEKVRIEAITGTFLVVLRDSYLDPGLKFTKMQVFVTTCACLIPEKDVPVEVVIFVLKLLCL